MRCIAPQAACELAINAVKDTNKYITDTAPWSIKDDTHRKSVIVRSTLEAIYAAAHFLAPYIPAAAATIFERLGTPPRLLWQLGAGFDLLTAGTPVKSGDVLFAKFEAKPPEAAPAPAPKPAKPVPPAADAPVDVSRLDIRVGQILKARPPCHSRRVLCGFARLTRRGAKRRWSATLTRSTCTWRASTWATRRGRGPLLAAS